ncbi:glycosyltransferase family 2 protein [Rothia sp. CCM 9417]|uniref:glycosyltransferase family 2 protein n=1 Tax=Rothia sp. CCM 9417 TaxID=3402657 RepID=UPI003AEC10B6
MTQLYDASIIICVKNGGSSLGNQLEAVANQRISPGVTYEVIVVDNGSTDETSHIIKLWSQKYTSKFGIKSFYQPNLQGIPAVRNFAASQSEGETILFCDADDEVSQDWAQAFIEATVGHKILAGGLIEAYDSQEVLHPDFFPKGLMRTTYLPHVGNCNCAISRSLFFEVGGYDESLPKYGFEDVDLSWRVQQAGYPVEFVEKARIKFRISGSSASFKKKFILGKGRVLMARRYPQYDSASYNFFYCIKKFSSTFVNLVKNILRNRMISRRDISLVVSSLGNLYGSVYYSGKDRGALKPRLMRNPGE